MFAAPESVSNGLLCARRLAPLALMLAGLAAISTGCGTASSADATGPELIVYSSLPLQGPTATISQQIIDGETLALGDAGGHAGRFRVGFYSLDDSNPATGLWSPGLTASDAKTAAQEPSTIAYLGELDSAATALSLPLINGAGILQISASSPYVGLTSSLDAGQDEPERFYPTGRRNFVRLDPGDLVQAAAQVKLMRQLGVKKLYVLDNEEEPFNVPLSALVAARAEQEGIGVVGHDSISTAAGASFTGEIERIEKSGAQAMFLSGTAGEGTAALWRELHKAMPALWLLGSSGLSEEAFTREIGTAEQRTLLTTPDFPSAYPPFGAQCARRLPASLRQRRGDIRAVRLRGDDARAVCDQGCRPGRQRSQHDHPARLLGAQPQLGARSLLDRVERRNDTVALWR